MAEDKTRARVLIRPGSAWRVTEVRVLREVYPDSGARAVHKRLPHRSIQAVSKMAADLGLRRVNRWTKAEDAVLREVYPQQGVAGVRAKLPHREGWAVMYRAYHLGLHRAVEWSQEDDDVLRAHYPTDGVERVMQLLPGRTSNGVRMRAQALGMRREKITRKRWTAHEDGLIRVHFPSGGTKACLPLLHGRTCLAISQRACLLGVHHSERGQA